MLKKPLESLGQRPGVTSRKTEAGPVIENQLVWTRDVTRHDSSPAGHGLHQDQAPAFRPRGQNQDIACPNPSRHFVGRAIAHHPDHVQPTSVALELLPERAVPYERGGDGVAVSSQQVERLHQCSRRLPA
jgi:hypothetical protein